MSNDRGGKTEETIQKESAKEALRSAKGTSLFKQNATFWTRRCFDEKKKKPATHLKPARERETQGGEKKREKTL